MDVERGIPGVFTPICPAIYGYYSGFVLSPTTIVCLAKGTCQLQQKKYFIQQQTLKYHIADHPPMSIGPIRFHVHYARCCTCRTDCNSEFRKNRFTANPV